MKFEKIKADIEANVNRWTKTVLDCLPDNENRADILRLINCYEIDSKANLYFHWKGKTAETAPKLLNISDNISEDVLNRFKQQWKEQVSSAVPWIHFGNDISHKPDYMLKHLATIDDWKASHQELIFTKDMKLDAFARKYYQGEEWIPKAGDYYTTTRNDLELYQVVEVTETEVHTSYLPLGGQVSKWPINEFTKEGFGPRRMLVPIEILCYHNVANFRVVMYNSKKIPHYHQDYVEAYLLKEERQNRMKAVSTDSYGRQRMLIKPLFEEDDIKFSPESAKKLLDYMNGKDEENR